MKNYKLFVLGILSGIALSQNPASAEVWSKWSDLGSFKPDQNSLIEARSARGHAKKEYEIQRIEKGKGDAVNVDEYVVQIDRLPNGFNKSQLFKHVRTNLNSFFDQETAKFREFSSDDKSDWTADTDARLGTIMEFEIPIASVGWDTAAVVVSKTGTNTWVFSPIEDGDLLGEFGTHPVAGNRQFGLRESAGKLEFYTRAFDRVYPLHVSLKEGSAFEGADKLWRSFQEKLKNYINSNGGAANVVTPNVPGGNDPEKKPQYKAVCKDQQLNLKC